MKTSNENGIVQSTIRNPYAFLGTLVLLAGAVYLLSGAPARGERLPANCSGSGLALSLFASSSTAQVGDTINYSITVFNGIAGGGRIACDASGIQAFIVTPDGVTNSIALVRTTLHQGESDSYPNAVSYVVRAQDVQPDGSLLTTAHNTGIIHQNDTDSSGGGFQGVSTKVTQP